MNSLFQSQPQLQIFEEILGFENYKPIWIATEDDIIFVQLEAKNTSAICPRCSHESHRLHQITVI